MKCVGCDKDDWSVRPCCTWEGNRVTCPACYLAGKGRVPGHVCGVGIQPVKGDSE